jgi:hypothetical protein
MLATLLSDVSCGCSSCSVRLFYASNGSPGCSKSHTLMWYLLLS